MVFFWFDTFCFCFGTPLNYPGQELTKVCFPSRIRHYGDHSVDCSLTRPDSHRLIKIDALILNIQTIATIVIECSVTNETTLVLNIQLTFLSVSTARKEISCKLPIGVATTNNLPLLDIMPTYLMRA